MPYYASVNRAVPLDVNVAVTGAVTAAPPPVWEYAWFDSAGHTLGASPAGGVASYGFVFTIPVADLAVPAVFLTISCTPGAAPAAGDQMAVQLNPPCTINPGGDPIVQALNGSTNVPIFLN